MNVDKNEDETGVNNLSTEIDAVIGDIDMWKEQEKTVTDNVEDWGRLKIE